MSGCTAACEVVDVAVRGVCADAVTVNTSDIEAVNAPHVKRIRVFI
jgi:hypothetical protein